MYLTTLDGIENVTFQSLANGRLYIGGQWRDVELSEELKTQVLDDVAAILGGRKPEQLRRVLGKTLGLKIQWWAFSRIQYSALTGNWYYCAGQDYRAELNTIRAWLYRL